MNKKTLVVYDAYVDEVKCCATEQEVLKLINIYNEFKDIDYNLELTLYANTDNYKVYLINEKGAPITSEIKKKLERIIRDLKETL